MNAPDGFIDDLLSRYHDTLQKQCAQIVHYDPKYLPMVDDCIQEAYCKAFHNYDSIVHSGNPYAWLVRCCINYFRSKIRQNIRRREIIGTHVSLEQYGDVEDPKDSLLRWIAKMDASDTLGELLESLTPLEAAVFHSYYQENLSLKDTAKNNGISTGSARAAVDRIKRKLNRLPLLIFIFAGQCIFACSRTV